LHKCPSFQRLILFRRYFDDLFGIARTEQDARSFLEDYGRMDPSIRLDSTVAESGIDFLDTTVYRGPRFLERGVPDIKVFSKPIAAFHYIPPFSYHSYTQLTGFIRGQLIRILRCTSNESDWIDAKVLFASRLRNRGYRRTFIERQLSSVHFAQRDSLLWMRSSSRLAGASRVINILVHRHPAMESLPSILHEQLLLAAAQRPLPRAVAVRVVWLKQRKLLNYLTSAAVY
jgi:hypothetical protein